MPPPPSSSSSAGSSSASGSESKSSGSGSSSHSSKSGSSKSSQNSSTTQQLASLKLIEFPPLEPEQIRISMIAQDITRIQQENTAFCSTFMAPFSKTGTSVQFSLSQTPLNRTLQQQQQQQADRFNTYGKYRFETSKQSQQQQQQQTITAQKQQSTAVATAVAVQAIQRELNQIKELNNSTRYAEQQQPPVVVDPYEIGKESQEVINSYYSHLSQKRRDSHSREHLKPAVVSLYKQRSIPKKVFDETELKRTRVISAYGGGTTDNTISLQNTATNTYKQFSIQQSPTTQTGLVSARGPPMRTRATSLTVDAAIRTLLRK